MEVSGKINIINEIQIIGNNGFQKREMVITTDEQYPQTLLIEFVQDKCNLLNDLKIGEEISVSINLRGREWINKDGQTKYFNSIQGWKISTHNNLNVPPFVPISISDENEDLPF